MKKGSTSKGQVNFCTKHFFVRNVEKNSNQSLQPFEEIFCIGLVFINPQQLKMY